MNKEEWARWALNKAIRDAETYDNGAVHCTAELMRQIADGLGVKIDAKPLSPSPFPAPMIPMPPFVPIV